MMKNNIETPLYYDSALSCFLGINLFIKRDDLYPISGGGNKGRKAEYILSHAKKVNSTAVITCGGLQSNHTRATAIKCKELGLKCSIIVHDKKPDVVLGNYKLLKLLGVKVVFCDMSDVSNVMDAEMVNLEAQGEKPFYIWGGGHCVQGSLAYFDVVDEINSQVECDFDYVFLACGTGTTQAGLHVGFKSRSRNTKVIGISIAREKQKGSTEVHKSSLELCKYLNIEEKLADDILFDDSFCFGGYEMTDSKLIELIQSVAEKSGLILDPTYSGKAFYALMDYVFTGEIPKGSNVLFLHTGGLLNLMSSKYL
jgi:D-cysteine desulfhydrase